MPRLRFTVRRMMVAVAIAALIVGAEAWRRRTRDYYRAKAMHFYAKANELLLSKDGFERHRDRYSYYLRMSLKYAKAHNRPWLPVAPDPPEPN
jgi:hypothetical protein